MQPSQPVTDPEFRRIAFIGAGQMGGRLARLLMRAGHELIICDPAASVQKAFAADGAAIAATPAECASADVVIIFVMNGIEALSATLGPSGLLSAIDPSAPPLVLIMSTIMPDEARQIAVGLSQKGVHTVDAPVTGGPILAEQGNLLILAGGDPADVAHAETLLRLMGREVVKCGALGGGLTAKILNNMLGIANMYLMQECYRLGVAYGMPPSNVAAILEKGAGQNFWTHDVDETVASMDVLSSDPDYFVKMVKACLKDWSCAVELAEKVEMQLPFLGGMMATVSDIDSQALHSQWRTFVDLHTSASGIS
jgi:3-hydroxyisobutyrate dehydrogenase